MSSQRPQGMGDIAHDAADTTGSLPVKIGGVGTAALPAAVTEADRVAASFTLDGRLRTLSLGDISHDVADTTTSNPVKVGGVGTAALPTAVTEGDRVAASFTLDGRLRTLALGDIAHDGADTTTSNPLKIAGIAKEQDGTASYSVAEDDRVNAVFDRQGNMFVNIGHPFFFMTSAAYTAAQTNAQLATTPGASLSRYITDIIFGSDTIGTFSIVENTGTPVTRFRGYVQASQSLHVQLRNPIKLTANVDLGITTSMTNSSINILGYVGP